MEDRSNRINGVMLKNLTYDRTSGAMKATYMLASVESMSADQSPFPAIWGEAEVDVSLISQGSAEFRETFDKSMRILVKLIESSIFHDGGIEGGLDGIMGAAADISDSGGTEPRESDTERYYSDTPPK